MRPHRLRMTAFGPFAGTVEVDLDRLASGGLFLLHGETGAGKTTLLDGLGFALYGSVPGARQRGGRLRSDHAAPGVRTEVQLEVTLAGRRWRISRSPAQERPKARGTGSTTEQARVLLEELRGGSWQPVSTRLDEVARELDPLLGMSADQFFQVVLLPQGEFARFLRADSKERGQLLQRLFGTERFRAVEEWLAASRSSTAAAVAGAQQRLQVLVARLAQAAGCAEPEELAGDGRVQLPAGWATSVLQDCLAGSTDAAVTVGAATRDRDRARAAAEATVQLAARQERRRAADDEAAALEGERPALDDLGRELAAADRAAELAAVLSESAARAAAAAAAAAAELSARSALQAVGRPTDTPLEALRRTADAARERTGRLEGLRGLADDLAAERSAAAVAAHELAATEEQAGALADLLALLPPRRVAAQDRVQRCRLAAAALPGRAAELQALAAAVDEAHALAAVEGRLAQLRDEHLLARETAVSLREKEGELRDARLTSMVAELAATLEPGSPCEVCGSTQHPDPYEGAGEGVSREDEERARGHAEHATRVVAELGAAVAAATATAEGGRRRLAEAGHAGAQADQLRRRRDDLAGEVGQLHSEAGGLDVAVQALERVDEEQARADSDLAACVARGAGVARRRDEAQARAGRLADRLRDELDGADDLAAALAAAQRLCAACESVVEAAERAGLAAQEAVRAGEAADLAAAAAGTDPRSARVALRDGPWRERARARRRRHDDRTAAVVALLADPELAVSLEPAADVAVTAERVRSADAALAAAVGELAAARERVRQVGELAPQVDAAAEALGPLVAQAALARRLADLCAGAGSNALRMSLSSFVLAARLEEVAVAASGRLLRMTQGRYTLRHTDGAARAGARSGLGLLVRDGWTGCERDPGTLSGGETFQASLALALGLADVVQAEAGGARIEALFVDEGFGTLDEDTLDEVMDVLDGLREGGRLVGLVSHVAELRARIPAQVHVHKARAGSTLSVLGC